MKINTRRNAEKIMNYINNKILPPFMIVGVVMILYMICAMAYGCAKHQAQVASYFPQSQLKTAYNGE